MRRSSGTREVANLSDSIHRQLNMYAFAASAAGVGLLALAHSAEAKIVYTPAHISLDNNNVDLDLNHDGINDFSFGQVHGHDLPEGTYLEVLYGAPAQKSNRVRSVESNGRLCAAARPKGVKIGPANHFQPGGFYLGIVDITSTGPIRKYCPWAVKVRQGYVGLRFVINGQTHFGWAHIQLVPEGHLTATITGYAYETIPNRPIITGATKGPEETEAVEPVNPASLSTPTAGPASLGALALGAPGLSIWRRKELALEGS